MTTLISPYAINLSKPYFPSSIYFFHFHIFSRENRIFLRNSHRIWLYKPRSLNFSIVRANSSSDSASYGGWDDLRLVGGSNSSGELDGFRNFLVSIGIDDTRYVFFILGLFCALAISKVRISTIVVFPASLLVFAIGFSFGLVRSGSTSEVSVSDIKKRENEESLRLYADKLRKGVEIVDGFDVKVNNLKNDIQKAIDSREVTTGGLENYIKVLETVSLSALNARNIVGSNVGSSNSVLDDNQKSSKSKKELSEIGYDILQSIGGLFGENLLGSKPKKVKSNVKRGTMDSIVNEQTSKNNVIPLVEVEERVQNSVDVNKPKANTGPFQDSQNKCALDENGNERSKSGNTSWDDTGGRMNSFTARKEYSSKTNRLRFLDNDLASLTMGRDNVTETWDLRDALLDSVDFNDRMKHMENQPSFEAEKNLKKSDGSYRPSSIREKSKNNSNESLLRDDFVNGKDNSQMASDVPSTSSSKVSDDVIFDRYLNEANEMLKQAKEFILDRQEKDRAEIILYRCAKLLSKAIAMKPMSLLAVGQLGNTYLLHGELKLRISQELRSLIFRSNPSSVRNWTGEFDQISSKDEIASVLIDVCEECEELLIEAGRKYRLALSIDGNDVRALYNWGLALFFRAQLIADIGPEAAFDADKLFLAAIDKFDAMLSKSNVNAPYALYRWGMVLQQRSLLRPSNSREKVKLLQQAQRLYEDALDMDSSNPQLREALSRCLFELSGRSF